MFYDQYNINTNNIIDGSDPLSTYLYINRVLFLIFFSRIYNYSDEQWFFVIIRGLVTNFNASFRVRTLDARRHFFLIACLRASSVCSESVCRGLFIDSCTVKVFAGRSIRYGAYLYN